MMKILLSFGFCLLTIITFGQTDYKAQKFGDDVRPGKATSVANIESSMADLKTVEMKVEGKVVEVCKKKGCFMLLETADGKGMRVTFKDYAFFMPMDIVGKTVVLDGVAKKQRISVEKLKHYAEDAHKSKEEIAKITEPRNELAFEAKGVVILDN